MVGTPDIITHENFGDDRIRDLGVAGGQILPFPIDFDRRPYNTLALPCECMIIMQHVCGRPIKQVDPTAIKTHHRSSRGRVFTGQMTQPTVSQH